ncbi:MAG: hypothetical protein L3J95_00515 [Thermoplasmata archaeon]|nr:hypothetical protein [Thermoplasmata archaeon]
MAQATPAAPSLLRGALAIVLAAIAAIVFLLVYLGLPGNDHVGALLSIGVLSLVFALVTYFGQSLSSSAGPIEAVSWGFTGLGFGLLLLTLGFAPASTMSFTGRLLGFLVVLIGLALVIVIAGWRWRGRALDTARAAEHTAWTRRPPTNALDYPAAGPSTSGSTVPPKEGAPR